LILAKKKDIILYGKNRAKRRALQVTARTKAKGKNVGELLVTPRGMKRGKIKKKRS
jgi:hypothetical protein